MMIAISIMMVAAAACIMVFIIANPKLVPVLSGQHWVMPGLGKILIVKTLGTGASFGKNLGKHIDVKYQLENGEYGHCTKVEVRATGRLLPYDKVEKDRYIRNILDAVRHKSHEKEWVTYTAPPGWRPKPDKTDKVYEAEIIEQPSVSRASGSKLAIDDVD